MLVDIAVNTDQWDKLKVTLVNAPGMIARRGVAEGAPIILEAWRRTTRVRTGANRDSMSIEFLAPDHASIATHSGHGLYEDQPTRPHFIEPRNRFALRFKIGSQTIFAKRVFHPGTQGSFSRQRAVDLASPSLTDLLRRITAQELQGK